MHELYSQKDLPYLSNKICPKCGKIVPIDNNVCPHCNFDYSQKESKEDQLKEADKNNIELDVNEKVEPVFKKAEAEPQPQINLFCECCGSKLLPGQIYCSNCGARASKKICTSCHNLIDLSLLYCPICGEKQAENAFTKAKEPAESLTQKPVEEASVTPENEDIDTNVETTEIDTSTIEKEVEDSNKEADIKEESIFVQDPKTIVKLGRKRFFTAIQMAILLFIAAVVLFIPVYVEGNLFTKIIPYVTDINKGGFVKGMDVLLKLIDADFNGLTDLNVLVDGHKMFELSSRSASIIVLITYAVLYILVILGIIVSIFSLCNKKPYRTSINGLLTIFLFAVAAVYYIFIPIGEFKGYETYFLYIFILSFFYWFITKIIFGKEIKLYAIAKMNQKKLKNK